MMVRLDAFDQSEKARERERGRGRVLERKPERQCFVNSCGCYSLFVTAKAPALNTEMVASAQTAAGDKDGQ